MIFNTKTGKHKKRYERIQTYLNNDSSPLCQRSVHIGHLAGVYVPADIYARYLRLKGEEVLLIGGSDEHGVPITIKAKKEGVTPQDIVDRYHGIIKDSFEGLGISFDVYGIIHLRNPPQDRIGFLPPPL